MKERATRRAALVAGLTAAVAAILRWSRREPSPARRLRFPRRTTPGNRYRRYELGSRPLLLREDLFEGGVVTNLRRQRKRP